MRQGNVDASTLAAITALAEKEGMPGSDVTAARLLRHRMLVELNKARAAFDPLIAAVEAVLRDGTGLSGEDGDDPYPDEAVAFDIMQSIVVGFSQLEKWLASLEGRGALKLLLGAPGVVGPVPTAQHPRRVLLAADGNVWELGPKVLLHADVRASYERNHGKLLDVELWPVNARDPEAQQHVRCGEVKAVTISSALARPQAVDLHRLIVDERARLATKAKVDETLAEAERKRIHLTNVRTGERFVLHENGVLFGAGGTAYTEWPGFLSLHRVFPAGSPEPDAMVSAVWSLDDKGLTLHGNRYNRVVRDRRDHDRDLWKSEGEGFEAAWSQISSNVDLVDNDEFKGPRND